MSGKNLPGGLIHIKDNADGTCSYVFDKFCIFEKGYMNGPYSPLVPIIQPTTGGSVPVFNYGLSNGVLFYFTDGKGNTITVQQNPETGNYTLTFPSINTNDTLVTTNVAQTLTNKTLTNPIMNQIQFGSGATYTNLVPTNHVGDGINTWTLLDATDTLVGEAHPQTLLNKTLTSPVFSGTSTGLIQNSSQYCFEAYLSTATSGVTGTGNSYTVIFDQIPWQIGSGYSSATGVYTAPVAGLYKFNTSVVIFGLVSTNTFVGLSFSVNSTGNAFVFLGNQIMNNDGYMVVSGSRIFNMIAGDTISVNVTVNGTSGSNNASVSGGQYGTWLQMHLLTSYV